MRLEVRGVGLQGEVDGEDCEDEAEGLDALPVRDAQQSDGEVDEEPGEGIGPWEEGAAGGGPNVGGGAVGKAGGDVGAGGVEVMVLEGEWSVDSCVGGYGAGGEVHGEVERGLW